MKVTLLQKPGPLTAPYFVSNLEKALSELKSDLSASAKFVGTSKKGWARVDVSGDDEEILGELVIREFGLAHPDLSEVEMYGIYDGVTVTSTSESLQLDLGIETPRPLNVTIPLSALRAQLADGRGVACRDLVENYCLSAGVKISARITGKWPEKVEAWLSDEQINRISDWFETGLDRILVFDCFKQQLESAIAKAQLSRDIIYVEPIRLTTQVAVCKLGTDAVGLMPKLGSILRKNALKPFIPRRIIARCRQW
jgi:hypothetical protein